MMNSGESSKKSPEIKQKSKDRKIKLLLISAVFLFLIIGWSSRLFDDSLAKQNEYPSYMYLFYGIYGGFITFYLLYRAILMSLYKAVPPNVQRPSVSIVIPAYNEGSFVRRSIISAIQTDYPKGKKEVFCIDDGSTDDTWKHIKAVEREFPGEFIAIRSDVNKGKRDALSKGFRRSTGEIIITLDSDSEIKKDALPHMVAPFVDKTVGATTGNIRVSNKNINFITKMVAVRYTMAFNFFRASWSTFGAVFCCSGVLSAYRRSILMEILDDFENQMFLGKRCTYGDDRALTNLVLKRGYYTLYARKAVAHTLVPTTLKKLFKMITRWNKSFIRETYILSTFIFTKYRKRNRLLPIIDYVMLLLLFPIQFIIITKSVLFCILFPYTALPFITTAMTMGSIYMLFYVKLEKNLDFIYGIFYSLFYIFILVWTLPYSAMTLRDGAWLTR